MKKRINIVSYVGFCAFLFGVLAVFFPGSGCASSSEALESRVLSSLESLQIPFVANHGQLDPQVAYFAKILNGTMFVTVEGELVYRFGQVAQDTSGRQFPLIKEKLIGAQVENIIGLRPSTTRVNYFQGGTPEEWVTGVETYMDVNLGEVYSGIELRLKAYGNNVEKLFYVAPGALPGNIRLEISGADSLQVNEHGQLLLTTEFGSIAFTKPVAWQVIDGKRNPVTVEYEIIAAAGHPGEYRFDVGSYDPAIPLVIDPLLASTFIGGSGDDTGHSIALDSQGNVYVTGETSSASFPANVYDTSYNGGDWDVFVAKLSPDLTTLQACTFLGGSNKDVAYSLAIDATDSIYITGTTASPDYPVNVNSYDTSFNNNTNNSFTDIFVSKLSSDLSTLVASTFIGGVNSEEGRALRILSGDIFVTGFSSSPDFPTTTGAYATTLHGTSASDDIIVLKMPSDLSTVTASTFLGGSNDDSGRSLAFDSDDNVFVTGGTSSDDFPSTTGHDFVFGGGEQVFIAKLPSDLTALTAASVIGSGGYVSIAHSIQVDSSDNIFITGETDSSTFPTTAGAYDRSNPSSSDAFVTRMNNDLTSILASTFLGTGSWETGYSLVLDDSDNVYVSGFSGSGDFPTSPMAYDHSVEAGYDAFITKFSPTLTTILASTLLGTTDTTWSRSLARDSSGNVYITGNTFVYSDNYPFPTTPGAYDTTWNSGKDVFISRFDSELSGSGLQFSSIHYNIDESAAEATVTVTRTGSGSGAVSVSYSSTNGTAIAGSDYTAVAGTLQWADGDSSDKSFTIQILPDTDVEGGETVNLILTDPVDIALGAPQLATLTIIDDETPGTLQFTAATSSVNENDLAGTATVVVSRSGGNNGIVTVDYISSNGTAVAGVDYTASSGTLSWADGETADKSFLVTISDNSDLDGDKTLTLSLESPTGMATLGTQDETVLTIVDDEVAGSLQFSQESYPVMESVGNVLVTVTRLGGTTGAVSVEYFTLDDTALEGIDYSETTGVLSWADGDSSTKTFLVPIVDDSVIEGEEKITLTLHNQTGSATLGVYNVANINISDDDDPAAQDTLQFSTATYTVSENGSTATITVTRTDSNAQDVSVQYTTANGTAVSGSDYTVTSGTLDWPAYDSNNKTFSVPILDDAVDEGNETLTLSLSSPTGSAVVGSINTASLTILDDDVAPTEHGSIEFDVPVYSAWENDGSFDVTVFRVNGSDGEVTVEYATSDNTAIASSDYNETSGMLTWPDGDGDYKTFTVQIIDDEDYEGDELVNLTLSQPGGGATLGTRPTAVLKIMENEQSNQPGTLQFSASEYTIAETTPTVLITVTRTNGSNGFVQIDYATSDGTAVFGGDYDEMSGSLEWEDGDTAEKTFLVNILDDDENEGDETVQLSLSNPIGGAVIGAINSAVITIVDDEAQPIVLAGDLNNDSAVTVADAILGLQVLCNLPVSVTLENSLNPSTPPGLDDVIYVLGQAALPE